METSYERFADDTNRKKKINKGLVALLIFTCILLIVAAIIAGVYGSKLNKSSRESDMEYCTTTACLQLAASLSQSINTSVDPCHDFYHYVCDGWVDENSWINIDEAQWGRFHTVMQMEQETFLDELFYNTKATLVDHSSVQKAAAYFQTCYDSTLDIETAEKSQFITQLINKTLFASSNPQWDSVSQHKFQNVITYLTQVDFNTFFKLESQSTQIPTFIQNLEFWRSASALNISEFIPMYESILGLDKNLSQQIALAVQNFAVKLFNISTILDPRYAFYQLPRTLEAMSVIAAFDQLSSTFGSNEILDYTQLVYDAYGISESDTDIKHFKYYAAGLSYFQALAPLIQKESPPVVQFYVWTSILYYYLDFAGIFSQTRYDKRSDFCADRTKTKFPFVYGYILFNKLYSDEAHKLASTLASTIKIDGTKALIENATWLDDASKAAALRKINEMKLYIGFPERIKFGDNIDKYYEAVQQSMSTSWVENVAAFTKFDFKQFNDTFWGHPYNLTSGWPEPFSVKELYNDWLTGINAFYWSLDNWFTIPVSISQPPFLDASTGYPSSITFGGLGSVCGHEMSHGFDPSGSQYNYNGTNVGSIFTNDTQLKYSEKMKCFMDQYDKIAVDTTNGTNIYVNGTFTITENVADNAGVWASWTSWKKYITENGNDKPIYGISLTQEQLFFVGFASLWCESDRSGSVVTPGDIHSPNYARVIGALANNIHFAEAFSCDVATRMNPKNKCIVW